MAEGAKRISAKRGTALLEKLRARLPPTMIAITHLYSAVPVCFFQVQCSGRQAPSEQKLNSGRRSRRWKTCAELRGYAYWRRKYLLSVHDEQDFSSRSAQLSG